MNAVFGLQYFDPVAEAVQMALMLATTSDAPGFERGALASAFQQKP